MSRQEAGAPVSKEREAALWAALNRAVDELGGFEVFKSVAPVGVISPEARAAAFRFAAAYGRCMLAGLDLEPEPYFPAEILPSIALALGDEMRDRFNQLSALSSGFLADSTPKEKKRLAKDFFRQYIDIAAAAVTVQEIIELYKRWVYKSVPLRQQASLLAPQNNRLLQEAGWADRFYLDARGLASKRAFKMRDYISKDLAEWDATADENYKDVIRPFRI